jgi:squalene-hopene/tetraprenyl-beta-curcumene cyclase
MSSRLMIAVLLSCIPLFSADWNPRLAADYLDSREKEWFAWPAAKQAGTVCISCHTGMTYMLVRPALRDALGEKQATEFEQDYSKSMRARVERKASTDGSSVDAILSAMLLAAEDALAGKWSAETQKAFDRMWSAQMPDGAMPWYSLNLDPWEMPESRFYGASMAALAVGYAPAEHRQRADVREHVARLTGFLKREEAGQPLHNRLAWLWASSKLTEAATAARRASIVDQAMQTQQPDGGWTLASLGPWKAHTKQAALAGSDSYATAFTAFVLEQAGVPNSDPRMKRALAWLRSHQDAAGYWDAASMNKKYDAGSMMELFMRDAATGFAAMALLHNGDSSR